VEHHVIHAHGFKTAQDYRQHIFGREVLAGPQCVSAQIVRTRLLSWKRALRDEVFLEGVCSCCAQSYSVKHLVSCRFPVRNADNVPTWLGWSADVWKMQRESWYDKVNELLNVERLLQLQFHADDRVREAELSVIRAQEVADANAHADASTKELILKQAFAQRVRQWRDLTRQALRDDGVVAPNAASTWWVLFQRPPARLQRHADGTIECDLCVHCAKCFSTLDFRGRPAPKMPLRACANGSWQGREPQVISTLTWAERRVLRLARVYCSVKRILAQDAPWARNNQLVLPQYSTRNVVAFLQNPDSAVRTLCLLPADLSKDVYVQFEGSDPQNMMREPALQVNVEALRSAIWWYSTNCYQWLEATKDHALFALDKLGPHLEGLLAEYEKNLEGGHSGVPRVLTEIATSIKSEQTTVLLQGPADADVEDPSSGTETSECDVDAGRHPRSTVIPKKNPSQAYDHSMVVSSTGIDETGPLTLWTRAMAKYDVLNQLQEQYNAATHASDEGSKLAAIREEAHCLAEAVHALRALASSETRKTLIQFHEYMKGSEIVVPVGHATDLVNTFDPYWWVFCFTDLFFRGDFRIPTGLGLRQWSHGLLQRKDFLGWAMSKEFAATAHNLIVRRAQMWNVHKYLVQSKYSNIITEALKTIGPGDFVRSALAAGDCESIRQALRKKNIDTTVKSILKSMDVALRGVEGSESERDIFRFKFIALHLWSGCSLLFFTLNPHDLHSPLLLVFLGQQGIRKSCMEAYFNTIFYFSCCLYGNLFQHYILFLMLIILFLYHDTLNTYSWNLDQSY
jgi:hypothetical protein